MKKFIKSRISKLVASSTALTLALSSVPFNVFASNTADTVITIYHTNDMHGNVKDLANVKTLKDATKNSILVDAGDCTQGSALATYTKGEAIIEIMNATSYDAIALGNHEFDFGSQKAIDNMKKAKFSPLAANVMNNKGELILNGINNGNGANVIKEIDGKKIGIFGLTTEETAYKTNPKNLNGVEFKSVIETAKKQVEILKKQNVDAIVAVTHLGNDASSNPTSIDLAKEVPELDLIIDGHSHTIIQEKVGDVTVVQTGTGLKNLGKVELNFKGNDLSINYELLNMEEVVKENKANETVSSVYNKYDNTVSETLKEVIGKTTTELYAYAEDGTRIVRIEETPMGDLIADAMVFGAKKLLETTEYKNLPIVALENGGGVRSSISAGDITLEDVFN
ncbi:MAG: bifunctional metallophosphatase/5'-nucleotidase, partial [Eubacteriales bacterium]|nr:bifunctional metallophosphatase/5'-nucleotidase [Eubacteriales bacterium]